MSEHAVKRWMNAYQEADAEVNRLRRSLEIAERGIMGAMRSLGDEWQPEFIWKQYKACVHADLQSCLDDMRKVK